MEPLTLIFVFGLGVAALYVTLLVRRDFLTRDEMNRERRRQLERRVRGRRH